MFALLFPENREALVVDLLGELEVPLAIGGLAHDVCRPVVDLALELFDASVEPVQPYTHRLNHLLRPRAVEQGFQRNGNGRELDARVYSAAAFAGDQRPRNAWRMASKTVRDSSSATRWASASSFTLRAWMSTE